MNDDTPAETGWLYRRWYSFTGAAIIYILLLIIILSIATPDPLKWIALALIGWGAVKDGLYMAGASIIEYAKLAGAWKGNQVNDTISMVTERTSITKNGGDGAIPVRDDGSTGKSE
jgi:hypothetical protein